MKLPEVGEEKRFCWSCGQAVGRSKGAREGRTKGFCPNCGAAFDFDPKLGPGLVVGGQYEVVGCLAHGGFGWIYLAVDKNVADRAVVLKGVLNQGDTEAVAAAIAEKRFLAELEHGNIVEIYNFVEHGGAGYIVMEFVGGKSLKTVLKDRMVANGGKAQPLPVDQAIAYTLGILPALGYLHRRGYLYCDYKPDNVMHQGEDLKLIDLGGVRKIDDHDSSIYGTVGFQAPEIATTGPSISSDIYTVVRTLAVMTLDLPGYQGAFKHSLPDVADEPLFQRFESFYRLLVKGTAPNPDDRFQSTDELADQLLGVLREAVAVETRQSRPSVSSRFTGDRWAPETGSALSINNLPDLKPNPEDPAASFLAEIVAEPAQPALERIGAEVTSGRVPDTIEVKLRAIRAYGESDDINNAQRLLAAVRTEDPWEWRASWYEGLVAMSRGTWAAAVLEFDRVRTDVPGELAPKLAAAMAAEGASDFPEAAALYQLVLAVDPAYVTAAFGLARCRAALGDVDGAVAILDTVPAASAARGAALEQIGRLLLGRAVATGAVNDAAGAARAVEASTSDARRRAELSVDILSNMLDGFGAGRLQPQPQLQLFGQPATETGVRTALEKTLRELARTAPDSGERIRLIDHANQVRPKTLW
jgi:serine/threonine-protein kinase PknG